MENAGQQEPGVAIGSALIAPPAATHEHGAAHAQGIGEGEVPLEVAIHVGTQQI